MAMYREIKSKLLRSGSRNAISAVAQVAVDFLVIISIYSFTFRHVNAAEMGTWALISSYFAFSRISDVTIAPTVTCFVAKQRAAKDCEALLATILGGLKRVVIRLGIGSSFVMSAIIFYVNLYIDSGETRHYLQLALLCWAYTVTLALAGCLTAALDGLKRTDLRAVSTVLANLVRIAVTFQLVKQFGILGFALGFAAYATTLLIATTLSIWHELSKTSAGLSYRSGDWSEELVAFGRRYHVAGVLQMFLEPASKAMFPFFADLSSLGYFDVASKLVQQIRAAILSPISILLASFSAATASSHSTTRRLYIRSSQIAFLIASLSFSTLICMLPLMSELWLGWMRVEFVLFGSILALAWGLNAYSSVSYYYLLSAGQLNIVTRGNILMAAINATGGMLGGWIFGGVGFTAGVATAIAVGSLYIIAGANFHLGVKALDALGTSCILLSSIALLAGLISTHQGISSETSSIGLATLTASSVIVVLSCHIEIARRYLNANKALVSPRIITT
jgi:O-antigen/teichoic acid export membrane protein